LKLNYWLEIKLLGRKTLLFIESLSNLFVAEYY